MSETSGSRLSHEERMPPLVRLGALGLAGLLLAGAAYLIAVRGEAIVVDLATLAGGVWCF